jgi:hypothetical protein
MANGKLRWLVTTVWSLGFGILGCSAAPDDPMSPEEETTEIQEALCASNDLAISASSALSGTSAPAFDNNTGTRWESVHGVDPQWIQVDLGASKFVNRVRIDWEAANAKDYSIRISDDVNFGTFATLVTKTGMPGGNHRIDDLTGLSGAGRYVRVHGTARNLTYGYSIWEMDVYGDANTSCNSCTPTTSCAAQGKTCGSIDNGCGTVSCGSCASGQTCSASQQCVASPPPSSGSCFKIRSQRTNNYLFNNAGFVTPGASAASAEIFEKVPNGGGFQFKAKSTNTFVGISGDDLAVNGGATIFTEQDCSSGGSYPNGKGYKSPGGSAPYWKANTTTGAIDTNNAGNVASCVNGGAGSWERFYLESVTCPGGGVASNQPCAGACTAGQTCNISGQCVSESCGGSCGMGQKCVNSACVNDTTAGAGYYNTGKTLEAVPAGFFGPNTKIYKHDTSATTISNEIQTAHAAQRDAQFGTRRDGFLFAPGAYAAELDIGYGTQIAGLGDHPDTVIMGGALLAFPPTDMGNNGTQTVWRSIENFKHGNPNTSFLWAVSQGAPMRRVHATGVVSLHFSWGYQSGGFIADSAVDGSLHFGSQQQFYTRNSQLAKGEEGAWNIVYQGVTGTKTQAAFPNGPLTDIASTPKIREKPFLYVNRDGLFKVFVPAIRSNAIGPSWSVASGGQGTSIPLSSFHVVKEGVDTSTSMNNALASGKHLLLTPGIYYLDAPLSVNVANTVILGMGMATLTPNNGVNAINVADVDGVKIAGILIDAGSGNSDTLVQVGPPGSSANHAGNPTSLHDVFTRIGGRSWIAKAKKSLVINSNDVIVDHIWLWRADHGDNVGWTLNTAQNGLLVNGGSVTAYGTFVEHFQEYQVKWNGNNGKNYFFQSELPYEAPSQVAYDDPPNATDLNTGHGYASYKVADIVTSHEFYGGGCMAVFTMNDCSAGSQCTTGVCEADGKCAAPAGGMQASSCIEAPDAQAGVKFRNVLGVSLTAKGRINNLINSDGKLANPSVANIATTLSWH